MMISKLSGLLYAFTNTCDMLLLRLSDLYLPKTAKLAQSDHM